MLGIRRTLKEASLGYNEIEPVLFKPYSNKFIYLMAFLFGMGLILIGDILYIFPVAGLILSKELEYDTALIDYEGFMVLAAKLLTLLLIVLTLNKILKQDLNKTKKSVLACLIISLIGFCLIVGISFGFDYLQKVLNIQDEAVNEASVLEILGGKSGIAYAICICSITPFVEEMVFRKLAFSTFRSFKLPRWVTILIVALIFALIHVLGQDITNIVSYFHFAQYFLLSLTLTLVYTFTNENIYASTFVHILNNAMGLVLFFI